MLLHPANPGFSSNPEVPTFVSIL